MRQTVLRSWWYEADRTEVLSGIRQTDNEVLLV